MVNCNSQYINYCIPIPIPTLDTTIDNFSARGLYLSADVPHSDKNQFAPPIILGTANGKIHNIWLYVGIYPSICLISGARVKYYPTSTTHWLLSYPFVTWIENYSSPTRLSLSLTFPERKLSRVVGAPWCATVEILATS